MKNRISMKKILIFTTDLWLTSLLAAQVQYPHVFNPVGNIVDDTEKPARDAICLNGSWQFMPVYETDFVAYPSYLKARKKAAMGWMRKEFTLPAEWKSKRIIPDFEAIAGFAKIYVNGQLAGENLDIFFPTRLNCSGDVWKA